MAPALVVWAFGLWGVGFLGISSSIFTWGFFSVLAGVPAGVAVWLTTHKGRMPSDRWYRLGLALVAFASCVAWIYWLAALAVEVIEVRKSFALSCETVRRGVVRCYLWCSQAVVLGAPPPSQLQKSWKGEGLFGGPGACGGRGGGGSDVTTNPNVFPR